MQQRFANCFGRGYALRQQSDDLAQRRTMIDSVGPIGGRQTVEQVGPGLGRRQRSICRKDARPARRESLKRAGIGGQQRRQAPHPGLRKAAHQDVRQGGRRLTLPTGRDLDAMHEVKVEIGVGSQSQEMIVVIGRRDRCDGDLGRIGRAGRDELPRPSEGLDGLVIGGRGADGDNFRRVRLTSA